jgi:ATP-dependent Clp protease adaptor protein ClpS
MAVCDVPQTGTVTIEKTDTVTRLMPRYKILLHNDDHNDMVHVMKSLIQIFRMEAQEAEQKMWEAHKTGVSLIRIESKEVAELRQEQLQACSLVSTIEPE